MKDMKQIHTVNFKSVTRHLNDDHNHFTLILVHLETKDSSGNESRLTEKSSETSTN